MAISVYSWFVGKVDLSEIEAAELNGVTSTFRGLLDVLGEGIRRPGDFTPGIVPGNLHVTIGTGVAVIGGIGAKVVVEVTSQETVTGLTAAQTNYVFLQKDGTFAKNTTGTAPADSILVATATTNATEATSVSAIPAGRTHLPPLLGVRTVTTTPYTVADGDDTILADATAAAITVNLPAAASHVGRVIHVKKTDASANAVTLDGNGAETIDGAATKAIGTQYASYSLVSSGSAWFIL